MVLNSVVRELIICDGGLVILDKISDLLFFSIFCVFNGLFFLVRSRLILCGINFLLVGNLVLRNSVLLSVILNSVCVGIIINVCLFFMVCCSVFREVKKGMMVVLFFFF